MSVGRGEGEGREESEDSEKAGEGGMVEGKDSGKGGTVGREGRREG